MLSLNSVIGSILGLFLFASCSSMTNKGNDKKAALYFGAGTQNLMEKEYTGALKNLLEANRLSPDNTEILNNLGMAYYFKGEMDLAIRHLKKALEIDSENSDAKVNLASIYYKQGKLSQAEKIYKEVLKNLTYDRQARTHFNLGLIQLDRKDNVSAENYFKKAIKENDNYCPAYFQLGLLQYNRKQYNSSLKNMKEASMGTCYESPAPHYYQALSLMHIGKYFDARLKLDEVESRFKQSSYAIKARTLVLELDELEKKKNSESVASRKVLESPEF